MPESGNGLLAFVSDDRRSQLEEIFSSGCPMRPESSLRGCGESGSFGAGRFSGARDGCGANSSNGPEIGFGRSLGSGSKHRVPNLRRGFASRSEFALCELTFPDSMHEFDAGDRDRRTPKSLEPEHRAQARLDGSVVLFNQVVEVL